MWKNIAKLRNGLAALGLWLAVFALPLKVEQFPAALSWWLDMMPDRATMWMLLSAGLVAWIFWIDLRPLVARWLRPVPKEAGRALREAALIVRTDLFNFSRGPAIAKAAQRARDAARVAASRLIGTQYAELREVADRLAFAAHRYIGAATDGDDAEFHNAGNELQGAALRAMELTAWVES